MLNFIEYGTRTDQPDLLIVHGLYGSGRNWGAVAKRLAPGRRIVSVDQRNHGQSPWYDSHSYQDMAADLASVIEAQDAPMDVMGHSMGGKAAMVLALTRPELVNRLIVADISPVNYPPDPNTNIDAMRSVDLGKVFKRSDAIEQLAATITDPTLRSFFTQSLDLANKRWRLNLDVLEAEMEKIRGFPDMTGNFQGATLFLSGSDSDYVAPEHRPTIRAYFPKARFAKITGAGHWLHAEKPREYIQTVQAWLDRADY
ncbi:Pimeloyl-ACP methyl ester carboxylesterase [Shimia gijangensis]|uniref:Pimeloyl-ACP methyl ester carboxylesterase n=1 Tax=Shimia gijangensis TaxID=1470563 RepID=A0A1M6PIZ3_9RHOB|nr:alpha/beta fold hydrolase [Shimia gijangensis]SHK07901.1 Pimeloyl-ACP methyl ester carboxylesterase [Shimia gijangensis]